MISQAMLSTLQQQWIDIRGKRDKSAEREALLHKVYRIYQGQDYPMEKLAEEIGCSPAFLSSRFRLLGLSARSCGCRTGFAPAPRRKYPVNEEYFSKINTQEKAYLLGCLFTDGNVVIKGKPPTRPPTAANRAYASLPSFQGEERWRHGKDPIIGMRRLKAGGKAG